LLYAGLDPGYTGYGKNLGPSNNKDVKSALLLYPETVDRNRDRLKKKQDDFISNANVHISQRKLKEYGLSFAKNKREVYKRLFPDSDLSSDSEENLNDENGSSPSSSPRQSKDKSMTLNRSSSMGDKISGPNPIKSGKMSKSSSPKSSKSKRNSSDISDTSTNNNKSKKKKLNVLLRAHENYLLGKNAVTKYRRIPEKIAFSEEESLRYWTDCERRVGIAQRDGIVRLMKANKRLKHGESNSALNRES